MKDRQARERHGQRAERAAAWLLRLKGFRILARRARTPAGEIDLIARRGKVTVFCEVKARATPDLALVSIGPRQRRRIVNAAHAWLARHPAALAGDCRFDIVTVSPYLWPRHLPNAFGADLMG